MTKSNPLATGLTALVVAASPARNSHTRDLADAVAAAVAERGFTVTVVDLADTRLPAMDIEHYWSETRHPDAQVANWIDQVSAADAVVLATPVQHASYSGVLKSALDLLPADALEYTPVCLAAHAGGAKGSTSACEHLRTVVKALTGWVTPTQITTVAADFELVGGNRTLISTPVHNRCAAAAEELAMFASTMGVAARSPVASEVPV